jgi:putative aminopeptidase FrvX
MDKGSLKVLLKDLVAIPGVSANEKGVREYVLNYLKKTRAEIIVNNLGCVIAIFEGKDKTKAPAMIDAHMDEVGYIVQFIDKNGFLRLINHGNIDVRILPSQMLEVHSATGKRYTGVVGMLPPHVLVGKEATVMPLDQLSVDCGFN